MSREEYKTILSSVRPARVCVLIDRTDPDWQNSCVHVIEYFTTLWGGAYNIIVPTDGETIPDIFWQILETYDPDYVFRYLKTGADLKTARPDEYEQLLQRHIDSFMAANPASDRDRIRKQFDAELERALLGKDPVPNAVLQAEIKCRLAPFWFEDHIVEAEGIHAGSMGQYPLTLISEILGNCDSPSYGRRACLR